MNPADDATSRRPQAGRREAPGLWVRHISATKPLISLMLRRITSPPHGILQARMALGIDSIGSANPPDEAGLGAPSIRFHEPPAGGAFRFPVSFAAPTMIDSQQAQVAAAQAIARRRPTVGQAVDASVAASWEPPGCAPGRRALPCRMLADSPAKLPASWKGPSARAGERNPEPLRRIRPPPI
jgi:hypothetical protein